MSKEAAARVNHAVHGLSRLWVLRDLRGGDKLGMASESERQSWKPKRLPCEALARAGARQSRKEGGVNQAGATRGRSGAGETRRKRP